MPTLKDVLSPSEHVTSAHVTSANVTGVDAQAKRDMPARATVARERAVASGVGAAPIVPVVLCGGHGTRLWPLSRAMYPKQFVRFFDGQDSSLLGATLARLPRSSGFANPVVLCNNDHRFIVKGELERIGIEPSAIVAEPSARNTGPAITAAALLLERDNPASILIVMPSDHMIAKSVGFTEAVKAAAGLAATGKLVLFGIPPSEPNTGFGYIRKGPAVAETDGAFLVDLFAEKPDRATAESYVASKDYVWNSGILVVRADAFIREVERFEPAVLSAARQAIADGHKDLGVFKLGPEAFAMAPKISVDYAVMERTDHAVVLPIDVGWNDVGSWSALWSVAPHDENGNFIRGDALTTDTRDCYIHSERKVVATIGVEDLIVVDTPDALLVADRSRAQDVARVVDRLKTEGRREQEQHVRNYRPWGFFESLSDGPRFQVKKLHVEPGERLSLQMHHHRSEHWIVVQGTAKVVIGDVEKLVKENESVYIFATQWHRLENPGKVPLELIEVQIGTYLGEDDIVRSDDVYKRSASETK